jgi:quercetin dioxygenase-like cupin family protein
LGRGFYFNSVQFNILDFKGQERPMRLLQGSALMTAAMMAAVSLSSAQAAQAPPVIAWTAKPTQLTPYVAPHKPHTKLTDVLAKHRGHARWVETVVDDDHLVATWTQMAPGDKTKKQQLVDHRTGFIVWDGQVRVTIDGQEPFVATKGFMVQVPFRTFWQVEAIGPTPALIFESKPQNSAVGYAEGETLPAAPAGTTWYRTRMQGQDTYQRQQAANQPQQSVPYFDFFKATQTPPGPRGAFVRDDRNFLNIIRGPGVPRQPDTIKGHFHIDYGEFWFIMEGQISYLIEGLPYFVADPGDVVYAAPGRFHRAQFAAPNGGMSTRIAMNGYPYGSHHFDPAE